MDRRTACFVIAAASSGLAALADAQDRGKRVAWVSNDRPNPGSASYLAFRRGMEELGWVDGRNVQFDPWWGTGSEATLTEAVPRIVEWRPDVVVAQGGLATAALVRGWLQLPLVFTMSGDPVAAGLVNSYARPGGLRTGISFFALELVPKRFEFLRNGLPGLKRVAIVSSPLHAGEQQELRVATQAARSLGLEFEQFHATNPAELDAVFARIRHLRPDAILAFADALTASFADRFAAFSMASRIPSMSGWSDFAEQGNLMSYGPVLVESYHRLATFVDRILKGANPGEIPVEFPTRLELVVNRRAARAMKVTVAPALLARADRVID
jgi:putative ABC transport system substrate-binding protein